MRTARAGRLSTIAFLAVTTLPGGVAAQAAQGGPLQDATARLQSRDFQGAVTILETFTAEQPAVARGWMMLGRARMGLQGPVGARKAFLAAAELPGTRPTATYNVGLTFAAEGNADEAFEWLQKAKATGQVNLTAIGINPAAAVLLEDPRYRSLFPTPEELADPFVETAQILQEWRGEVPGDQFGWIARNVGDVDGDGLNDVVTSAPTNSEGGAGAGKVYVYSGGTGALLWSTVGPAGGRLGQGIEAAGDVNADGVPDVAAGAPGAGKAFVYSGLDGAMIHEFSAAASDNFGFDLVDAGDVDGDGYDDVFVGGSGADDGKGMARLYSGKDGSLIFSVQGERDGDAFGSAVGAWTEGGLTLLVVGAPNAGPNNGGRTYVYKDLDGAPSFVIESDETGAQLGGMFVSVLGDVDGDRFPDVYASDFANQALGNSTGRVYVHSGATGRRLYTLTGEAAGDGFGIGVADAGDVDLDGRADLVIGAWQHAGAAPSGGKVYVYSGADGSLMYELTGKVAGETLGFDATGMGDLNGDGVPDLLLTSAWSAADRGTQTGRMFIVSGAPSGAR